MREDLLVEVLAAHADHLNAEGDNTEVYLAMFPEDRETLAPLFELAAELKTVLAPVEIPPAFREQLYATLMKAAQEHLPASGWQSRLVLPPRLPERLQDFSMPVRLPGRPGRQVLVRAAAGGAGLAAAGVAAYVLHGRFFNQD